ncbi:MAG: DNA translocase FtsK 4TM domain-containing protein, partial [Robiginitalea sp.]
MAKTKRKTTAARKKKTRGLSRQNKIILGSLLILLSLALFFSFISFYFTWQEDQSLLTEFANRDKSAENLLNKFGAAISHFLMYKGFGLASFIFPVLICISGIYLFLGIPGKGLLSRWVWGLVLVIWFSISLGFFAAQKPLLGGQVGYEMNLFLQDYAGKIGVLLLLILGLVIIMVRLFDFTPEKVAKGFSGLGTLIPSRSPVAEDSQGYGSLELDPNSVDTPPAPPPTDLYTHKKDIPVIEEEPEVENKGTASDEMEIQMEVSHAVDEVEETDALADKLVEDFGEFDPTLELPKYKFPHLDLLDAHGGSGGITINQEELEENKNKIVDTLKNYKIGIAQIKATIGPTVTLYEIVPEAGVRISKIKNLEDDIALSLAALGIRIIAPIPGKGTIGIEVPNKNPTVVSMRSVVASKKFQNAEMQLPIAFGKTISNETFVVDLAKMPHLLMAGATGQGKSVGLNAILTSLLYKKHPAEVKFILVDPKKVELTLYNKIERHFLAKLPDSEEAI